MQSSVSRFWTLGLFGRAHQRKTNYALRMFGIEVPTVQTWWGVSWAEWVIAIGTAVIALGVGFAILQVSELRKRRHGEIAVEFARRWSCLLYTSDAADDLTRVDLGGRR